MRGGTVIRLWPLIFLAGLLPTLAVLLSFWLSVIEGHIPACNPFIDGCTTISRACRYGTAFYLFKALVLPSAVLLGLGWLWTAQRLDAGGRHPRTVTALRVLGLLASAFLVLYASFLGSHGDLFAFYRRIGATVFFSGSFFCQLLLVVALRQEAGWAGPRLYRLLAALVGGQFVLGLGSLPITAFVANKDRAENLIEWWFALLLFGFFMASAALWRGRRLEIASGGAAERDQPVDQADPLPEQHVRAQEHE